MLAEDAKLLVSTKILLPNREKKTINTRNQCHLNMFVKISQCDFRKD